MDELYHYGIKGQKWGVRRYQFADGSVTPAGAKRYYSNKSNSVLKRSTSLMNAKVKDIANTIIGGGFSVGIMKVVSVISLVKEKIEDFLGKGKKVTSHFSEILDSVHESLSSFTVGIKASTLITIAGAIGILALSLHKIAELSTGDIARSLAAMGTMFVMLNAVFKSINATLFMGYF